MQPGREPGNSSLVPGSFVGNFVAGVFPFLGYRQGVMGIGKVFLDDVGKKGHFVAQFLLEKDLGSRDNFS